MNIDSKTGLIGLFGNPSKHSLSPFIQNFFLSEYDKNFVYLSFEPEIINLKDAFNGAKNLSFAGINVTMPFKEDIFNLVDSADEAASVFRAVNTVKFLPVDRSDTTKISNNNSSNNNNCNSNKRSSNNSNTASINNTGSNSGNNSNNSRSSDSGNNNNSSNIKNNNNNNTKAVGYSTDGAGVIKSLEDKKFLWKGKKCLVLGAGGAAKSAVYSICQKPVEDIFVFDIMLEKTDHLFELLGKPAKIKPLKSLSVIEERLDEINLIINCTPAGMDMGVNDNTSTLAVPDYWSLKDKFVFDMVYKPFDTKLIKKARAEGAAEVIPGIDMLINQAAFSFKIWFEIMPRESLLKEIKDELVKLWI